MAQRLADLRERQPANWPGSAAGNPQFELAAQTAELEDLSFPAIVTANELLFQLCALANTPSHAAPTN